MVLRVCTSLVQTKETYCYMMFRIQQEEENMLSWIMTNLATILISILLIAIVCIIIVKMVKDKKQGKTSCGGDCGSCGACHRGK